MNSKLLLKLTPEYLEKVKAYAVAKAHAKAAEALKITLSKSEIDTHEKIRTEAEAASAEIGQVSYAELADAFTAKADAENAIKNSEDTANIKVLKAIAAYQKSIDVRQQALKIMKTDLAAKIAEQEAIIASITEVEGYVAQLINEVTTLTNEGLKISKA